MTARFCEKVAIITGSSNGIGRATAALFARDGAKVTITGRDASALQVTKEDCLKANAKEEDILEVLGDITKEEVQSELVNKTIQKFGKLDILVCNHGGVMNERAGDGYDLNAFEPAFDQNYKSVIGLCMKAIPHLKATKGEIVTVSSTGASWPVIFRPFYTTAKTALEHFTRILAFKHAKDGIRVNCVSPGFVTTTLHAKLGVDEETSRKFRECFLDAIPLGRIADPIDIAGPIAFLADRTASGYMTGQVIVVDGGGLLQYSMATVDPAKMIAEREKAEKK